MNEYQKFVKKVTPVLKDLGIDPRLNILAASQLWKLKKLSEVL